MCDETDDEGILLDEKGDRIYCDSPCCEGEAMHRVPVTVDAWSDSTRCYCCMCHDAYLVGVKQGSGGPHKEESNEDAG